MGITITNETIVPINIVAIHNLPMYINYSKYMCLLPGKAVRIPCKRKPTRFFIWMYSGPKSEITDTKLTALCAARNIISAISMGLSEAKHFIAERILDMAAITIQNSVMHTIVDQLIMEAESYAFTTIANTCADKMFLDKRTDRKHMKTKWIFNSRSKTIKVQGGPVLYVTDCYKELIDGKFELELSKLE
ncbi:17576_t:CDS:2 [Cetraspora pellucida]|uniref:17576_t:CDS:1 n=1 Tax=Cetraspora pellucida TaxID=1433469 RepID=A0A9N9ERI6_9GLOM|nr:17576_t:CDS:2 [Cetraspora pellucida]